jgi:hypothetical protein
MSINSQDILLCSALDENSVLEYNLETINTEEASTIHHLNVSYPTDGPLELTEIGNSNINTFIEETEFAELINIYKID